MFRNLIRALADPYHLVAPDLPGLGFSDTPDRKEFRYSFENLAKVIERFPQAMGIDRYAIYVVDYEAPAGFAWRCHVPKGSPPSSRRTAILMKKV